MRTPTSRRSRWFSPRPGEWDLAYLGWGSRFYGLYPASYKPIDNWAYQVVKSGNPIAIFPSGRVETAPGDLVAFGEGSHHGWTDKGDRRSEILIWIWKTPPRCPECVPPRGGYLLWKLPATIFRQFLQIHAKCREEVANPDGLTALALERHRLELELCLARMKQSKSRLPEAANRLDLAIRWMQQNLSVRRPVAFLCDYLQMSASALERLFLDNVGALPSTYFQRLKMQHAAQLLREDSMSVKEIAFSLGYTHASDFTRAFKTFTGKTPEAERRMPSRRDLVKGRK